MIDLLPRLRAGQCGNHARALGASVTNREELTMRTFVQVQNATSHRYVVPSQLNKNEWARMASTAYATGRNDVVHRFSAAASCPNGHAIPIAQWDALMADYRRWLCFNEWAAA
jgi:hypothetical protein